MDRLEKLIYSVKYLPQVLYFGSVGLLGYDIYYYVVNEIDFLNSYIRIATGFVFILMTGFALKEKMKKLILLLLFIPLVFSCSDKDENVPNMCIDETLINLETPCPLIYYPVCGCDGNTYSNSCEAFNLYGVVAFEYGVCD